MTTKEQLAFETYADEAMDLAIIVLGLIDDIKHNASDPKWRDAIDMLEIKNWLTDAAVDLKHRLEPDKSKEFLRHSITEELQAMAGDSVLNLKSRKPVP